jgi:gentisate 1,2-dioxygenase
VVAGQRFEWRENDVFVVPNHLWRNHINGDENNPAILYGVTDAPLLKKLGHYCAQGETRSGEIVELGR